jgi:hypothetical protein
LQKGIDGHHGKFTNRTLEVLGAEAFGVMMSSPRQRE